MKKRIKLQNDGYSLLEVIIVVAITAIITGVVFVGVSLVSSRALDECAKKMKMALDGNRVTTMGKLNADISFYMDGDGYMVIEENINGVLKTKKIGGPSLKIEYQCEGDAEKDLGDSSDKLTLSFNRSSGSLKQQASGDDAGKYVSKFIISQKTSSVDVSIDKLTGKVSIN